MITVHIDETKPQGRRILKELANKPKIASIQDNTIQYGVNGLPLNCTPWEEVEANLITDLSSHYGIDFNEKI